MIERLYRVAPGLEALAHYRRQDLRYDVVAGLSVAAVALPVGVAYAELAGFNPVVGLYSSILPVAGYALFGSSRQLIVGPDTATCALVAAAVAPLAAGDAVQYLSISMALAIIAGLLCIGASFLRLGVLADFLSRPILAGFMNGIALSIFLGQIGKLLGFQVESGRIVPRLIEVARKLDQTHWPTFAVGLGSLVLLVVSPKILPRLPAALVVMVVAGLAVGVFGLDAQDVKIVGEVAAGLPSLSLPRIPLDSLDTLLASAAGIALIAFSSGILTARSFAAKNGYDIDVDRDLVALGVANIASGISHGFAVSGADSRTATNDAAGGRTQLAGLVAAAGVALVLAFFTQPLRYVPVPALGAVLVMAAVSLVDIAALRSFWREGKDEFAISIIVTLGVAAVGAIQAILFAVVLSLLRFIQLVARPTWEVLGHVEGFPGFHSIARHPTAQTVPGLCLFRFNAPLVFFNASHFKRSALLAAATVGPALRWFVIDAVPVTATDVTGRHTVFELERELAARGARVGIAARQTQIRTALRKKGLEEAGRSVLQFPSLEQAVRAFREEFKAESDSAGTTSDLHP